MYSALDHLSETPECSRWSMEAVWVTGLGVHCVTTRGV
jgi:hypothetical protein